MIKVLIIVNIGVLIHSMLVTLDDSAIVRNILSFVVWPQWSFVALFIVVSIALYFSTLPYKISSRTCSFEMQVYSEIVILVIVLCRNKCTNKCIIAVQK